MKFDAWEIWDHIINIYLTIFNFFFWFNSIEFTNLNVYELHFQSAALKHNYDRPTYSTSTFYFFPVCCFNISLLQTGVGTVCGARSDEIMPTDLHDNTTCSSANFPAHFDMLIRNRLPNRVCSLSLGTWGHFCVRIIWDRWRRKRTIQGRRCRQ